MRHLIHISILLAVLLLFTPDSASAEQSDMIARMKAGGHILMIRHALAPGNGDPSEFKLGDCATQRNLDDRGRMQSREIGQWLRANGIKSARVYSSQWCRCLETAALMAMGTVTELAGLNSFYELPQNRESNLNALNQFISRQPVYGELIIMVTHYVTIAAITNETIASGEGVLLELREDASYRVVGSLKFDH